MAILNNFLKPIANAIRSKTGKVGSINAQNFASEIESIEPPLDNIEINANGVYDIKDYKQATFNYTSNDLEKLKALIERTEKTFEIPYGPTQIGSYAFYEAPFSQVIIPESVSLIDNYAFYKSDITNIDIPSSVKTISQSAFASSLLNNVVLNEGLELIGQEAFYGCRITEMTIPNSVTTMQSSVFRECSNLTKISFPLLESIPQNVVYGCKKLETIIMPEGVKKLRSGCFGGCSTLKTIKLPSTLTDIEANAFSGCLLLTNITIPANVQNIGNSGLYIGSSTNKCTIVMLSETPCTITTSTFSTSNLQKIYVPKGTSATYKSATNWSNYASYIYEPNNIAFNVDSSVLNNSSVTYSIDNGEMQQFTSSSFTLENVSTLTITNIDATKVIKVGTTAGGSEIGTIANATTTYTFEGDTTIYISVQ